MVVMKKRARKFIYSNKKHTQKGIFSTILAALSFFFLLFMIILSYAKRGEIGGAYGAAAFVCTVFSSVGIILGTMGKREPDMFHLFSYIGIIWNVVNLLFISSILYAGL